MGRRTKLILFATVTLLLSSCASQTSNSVKAPLFTSIAFVTPSELPALAHSKAEIDSRDGAVAAGAAVGTVGGAAVGAAVCGPVLYGACLAVMSWYGLVVGTAGGAALELYNYSGLSQTDSAYVSQVLAEIDDKRDFHSDLRSQVALVAPAGTIAAPQDADIQIVIWIDQITFIEAEREVIRTEVSGTMILAQALQPNQEPYTERFQASAAPQDIDDLIAGNGHELESAIDECLFGIAELMSIRLKQMLAASANESTE